MGKNTKMSDELESTLDKLFPLSRTPSRRNTCPDTIHGDHGEPNDEGFCTWCKQKITGKAGPFVPSDISSEAEASYGYMYDPDFGTPNWNRHR